MTNKKFVNEPITREFSDGLVDDLREELVTELKQSTAAVQMKVDPYVLLKLGMNRLGLRTNYWERAAYAVAGYCAGIVTAAAICLQ